MKQRRPGPSGGYDQKRDPHARKKTKRFRDRKDERGPSRPDGKPSAKTSARLSAKPVDKRFDKPSGKSFGKSGGKPRSDAGRPGEYERGPRRSAKKAGHAPNRAGTRPRRAQADVAPARRPSPPVIDKPLTPERETVPPSFVTAGVQTVVVSADEDGMRVDRFFEARFPGLSFSHIQRIIRKGEVRVNGKRTEPKARLSGGQSVRVPPLTVEAPQPRADAPADLRDRAFLRSIMLYEDDDVMVLNKPAGLAVQGGSGTTRHIDGMLGALQGQGRDAQRPRLVHRLDKDTAGCLLVAKTRFAAAALSKTFRSRAARKVYWALVYGVPKPKQGRISTFLAKQEMEEDSFMRVAGHGEDGASHAVTYYAVVETSAQQLCWLSLKPVTGRTHQLRAHMAHIRHPILGDPKYFNIENWQLPGGIQNRLHLLARRISVPHPRGGRIDVSAPLPPHMEQSWNLLGLDLTRYDPIEDAPED
jgi:23S rRNA pseudouridine955/2504/2580 synthase